jgi:hypothetical protein
MAPNMGRGSSISKLPESGPTSQTDEPPTRAKRKGPAVHTRRLTHRRAAEARMLRAKRGSSRRPSRSREALALRLEFRSSEQPHLSSVRLRKWRELRHCRKNWKTRWKKFRCLKGAELIEKAETGQWYAAILPEFRDEPPLVEKFLGWCHLAFCILGKPGLWISLPEIAQLMRCSIGTAKRIRTKLVTGEPDGKIEEAMLVGFQHWLIPRPDFSPTDRATDPKTGKKLLNWQRANWFEPGPLFLAALKAKQERLAKRKPKPAAPVEQRPSECEKNDPPSPKRPDPKVPTNTVDTPNEERSPSASDALSEGNKVCPSGTIDRGPAEPANRGAGAAGPAADQEVPSAPRRASGARIVPQRPIAPEVRREIDAAVAAGGDEAFLLGHAASDPEFALSLARCITQPRFPSPLPRGGPGGDGSGRDPTLHQRREYRDGGGEQLPLSARRTP